MRLSAYAGALALATVGLLGCHDKGDEDATASFTSTAGDPPPGASGPVTTHEFYQATPDPNDPNSGGLFALAPSSPGTPIPVDDGNAATGIDDNDDDFGPVPILGGTCHDGRILGAHVQTVAYAREDGTLQRVPTSTDSSLTPERISSEANAAPVCEMQVGLDFADHDNSRLVYQLAGPDCFAPPEWFVVRLGDGPGVNPQPFPGEPVATLFNTTDYSHAGWLVLDGTSLIRVSADNQQQEPVAGDVGFVDSLGNLIEGVILLNIDGNLHAFNPDGNQLTNLNFSFSGFEAPRPTSFATDGNELYFVDNGEALYRTDIASGSVVALDTPADASSFGFLPLLQIGSERVVWGYTRFDSQTEQSFSVIRSVDKATGDTAFDLDTANNSNGESFISFLTGITGASEWAFYNLIDSNNNQPTAIAKRMDDATVEESFPSALWSGGSVPADFTIGTRPATKIYRVDGLTDFTADWGTVDVVSVPSNDPGATPVALGTLPPDTQSASLLPGFGPDRLGALISDDGTGNSEPDVLYFDEDAPNSLTRITDTNDQDEFPLGFF